MRPQSDPAPTTADLTAGRDKFDAMTSSVKPQHSPTPVYNASDEMESHLQKLAIASAKLTAAPPPHIEQSLPKPSSSNSISANLLDELPGGFCAFDADFNLIVSNEKMRTLLEQKNTNPIRTLEDFFRQNALDGDYGSGDIEHQVLSRLRLAKKATPFAYDKSFPDGRVFEFKGHAPQNGGYILITQEVGLYRDDNAAMELLLEGFDGCVCVFDSDETLKLSNSYLRERLENSPTLFGQAPASLEQFLWVNARNGEYGRGPVSSIVDDRLSIIRAGEYHECACVANDGRIFKISTTPLANGGFLETRRDVTVDALHVSRCETIIDSFPGGLAVFDANLKLCHQNSAFAELLDYPTSVFENTAPTLAELLSYDIERGEFNDDGGRNQVAAWLSKVENREVFESDQIRSDGKVLFIRCSPLKDGGIMVTYFDVSKRVEIQAEEFQKSNYSVRTGLPNRNLFRDRLNIALAQCERGQKIALLSVDIHNFSNVKETFGQEVAYRVLRILSDRFSRIKRDTDTFAHMGDDEFSVVQVGIDGLEGAEILARRILRTVQSRIEFDGISLDLDACIGISLPPDDGTFADDVTSKAKTALFHAKRAGAGSIRFFSTLEIENSQ